MTGTSKSVARICEICARREHKTGNGICQFCWGSGIRETETTGKKPCIHCVMIFPQPPIFCIHNNQLWSCEKCCAELRDIGMDLGRHEKFCQTNIVRRIEVSN